jgi:tetratricopeptide (TPR) repeat protein
MRTLLICQIGGLVLSCNLWAQPASSTNESKNLTRGEIDRLYDEAHFQNLSPDSLIVLGKYILQSSKSSSYTLGKVRGMVLVGSGYLFINKLDSASNYLLQGIAESRQTKQGMLEEGIAQNYMGSVYFRLNNYEASLKNFRDAEIIFRNHNNFNFLSLALSNQGTCLGAQGDYTQALGLFLEALRLTENPTVPASRRAAALSNISLVYNRMGNKKEALDYAFKALQIDRETNNQTGISQSYNAIAGIYNLRDEYDSAIYYYQLAIDNAVPGNPAFQPIVARSLQNMSSIYSRQKKYQQAIVLINESQRMRKIMGEEYQIETFMNIIASNHFKLSNYDSAIYYARKALNLSKKWKVKEGIRSAYLHLQQSNYAKKRYDSAYFFQSLRFAYQDSIYNESNRIKFDNLRMELATLDKQREIEILQKERELEESKNFNLKVTLVFSLFSFTLVLLSLVLTYRNRQKRQRLKTLEMQAAIDEKNKELHQHAMRMISMTNGITEIENSLKQVKVDSPSGSKDVQGILKAIKLNRVMDKEWDNFDNYFGQAYHSFYENLDQRNHGLSITEKRLAGLIKMNMTNGEIAGILNIEYNSVKMAKYRLKKKLGLSDEQDINVYLTSF